MFSSVTAAFLDCFCLFRERKFNKYRAGWVHPEIMRAACKVQEEKADGEAAPSCSTPCMQSEVYLLFFCFITADTKLLEADIGSLNCGCPQAHPGSLIMCIAVPAGDADPDGDSISMHKGETHPSSHVCTARSQRTPVKNQQDTLGSVLPPTRACSSKGSKVRAWTIAQHLKPE